MSEGLAPRLRALTDAVKLSVERADDVVVAEATDLIRRAGQRMAISGDHTVVALAGATGSGKSSLMNAVTGTQIARVGVTRPTTSEAFAVAWGDELPTELLDWLDVSRRHLIASPESALSNLVLLDMPDHDSTEAAHKSTVDRLVKLVDMMVWVVDPQKYADAALHDGYLKPMAQHAEVMVVVLNQVDRLSAPQRIEAVADLRRLLDSQGLEAAQVMEVSAATGEGVGELRQLLSRTVSDKRVSARRFSADVSRSAAALASELGTGKLPVLSDRVVSEVVGATAEASGVPIVVERVEKAWRHRGAIATGWPMVSWMRRFKPDPLRRIRVGDDPKQLAPTEVSRTSLPKATSVQLARLDAAQRRLIDAATDGIPRGWADQITRAVRGNERLLADRLDAAIAAADLGLGRGRWWWTIVTILQWVLFLALIVGGVWLLLPFVFALLQMPVELQTITLPWAPLERWPIQTLLFVGGIVGGIALAALSRIGVVIAARLKARRARGVLTRAVADVVRAELMAPAEAELERLAQARDAVARALKG